MYVYEFHVVNCVLRILIGLERKNSKCTSGSVTMSQENSIYGGLQKYLLLHYVLPVVSQCHKRIEFIVVSK